MGSCYTKPIFYFNNSGKDVTIRYSLITKTKGILYYAENEQEKKNGMVTVPERAWSHFLQRFMQEVFL